MAGIGTLNEKPLHAALKEYVSTPGDRFEVGVEKYVIDIVRGDKLIEIQTGSFTAIRAKLSYLLKEYSITLIYPIPRHKWIVKLGPDGSIQSRRKSPRRGRVEDVFYELVRMPHLINHANLSLEILLTHEEEILCHGKHRSWRRKGWSIEERRLIDVRDSIQIERPEHWKALLPQDTRRFTTQELAEALGITRGLAQKMAYCYRKAGLITLSGKAGNAHIYKYTP